MTHSLFRSTQIEVISDIYDLRTKRFFVRTLKYAHAALMFAILENIENV